MSVKVWISESLRGATNFIVVSSLHGKLRVSGRPERIGGPLYTISLMVAKMIQILLRNFCPGTYVAAIVKPFGASIIASATFGHSE
jgi:hypothetical protein